MLSDLFYVGIILLSLFFFPLLLRYLKVPTILSFMFLGLLAKLFMTDIPKELSFFERIAIAVLFFFIGLEYSFEKLKENLKKILLPGLLDFGLNFIPIFLISYGFTRNLILSVALASALYPTSTAITSKLLMDYMRLANPEIDLLLGILIFEDVVSITLLSAIIPLSAGDEINPIRLGWFILLMALITISFYILDYFLSHKLIKLYDVLAEDNLLIFLFLGTISLTVYIAHSFNLSEALVAFLLGVIVSTESRLYERIERYMVDIRELSIGIFFFSFTHKIELKAYDNILLYVLLVFAMVFFKILSTYLASLYYGLSRRASLRASLSFVQRGEFSVIFASVYPPMQAIVVPLVMLSIFLGILLFAKAPYVAERFFPRRISSRVPPPPP
ncbi:cation:proton antiporter [Thermocrinis minervae]|uniref:Potassium/proton antiporter membrane subunit, CPA2 family n=1 Tax=Thermocrinis minervae TaxID=381751 RepID=A0A1M6R8B3_9AQUI|nr:cation:proton antiporter [Thermocrinis minervae]SHK28692.1 potassium/proton antiporter membrane subunit, CPA2 family [Thermocrinis minervae]